MRYMKQPLEHSLISPSPYSHSRCMQEISCLCMGSGFCSTLLRAGGADVLYCGI